MISSKLRMVASLQQQTMLGPVKYLKSWSTKNHSLSSNDDEHSGQRTQDEKDETSSVDKHIQPDLSVLTDNKVNCSPVLKTISVVPGKGPPPEPPVTCCMSGCANCVWIAYADELKAYYGEGAELKALDHIEDPSLKAFIKLELGIK